MELDGNDLLVKGNTIRTCEDNEGIDVSGELERHREATTSTHGPDGFGIFRWHGYGHPGQQGPRTPKTWHRSRAAITFSIEKNIVESATTPSSCYDLDGDNMQVLSNKAGSCPDSGFEIDGDRITMNKNSLAPRLERRLLQTQMASICCDEQHGRSL